MTLKNPSVNCFRKFKRLRLTFQVVQILKGLQRSYSGDIFDCIEHFFSS